MADSVARAQRILALSEVGMDHASSEAITFSHAVETTVRSSLATPLEAVEIGFVDPSATGGGFDTLRLQVEGATLLDLAGADPGAGFRTGVVASARLPEPALARLLALALVATLGWSRRRRGADPRP